MPREFTVRTAVPDNAAAVGRVLEASYPAALAGHYDPEVLAAALPLMSRANARLLASGTYHVAESREGSIIGCGGWTAARPGTGEIEPGLAHVRHFGTDPAWMRRGVGRALFEHCLAEAEARGVRRLECYSSLQAEDFYRALGFAVVRRFDLEMVPGVRIPSVLMARKTALP